MIDETGRAQLQESWQEPFARGRFVEAHKYYLLREVKDPEVLHALDNLAELEALVRSKSWNQALRRLGRLESPPDLLPWDELAEQISSLKASSASLDRRRAEEALAELETVSLPCLEAEVLTQRGTAQIFMNSLDEAEELFRKAIDLDPRHYRALTNLGNVALEQGRVDEAIASYQAALKINGEFGNAHHNLGVAYRRKGQVSRSVRSLRKAQRAIGRKDREDARSELSERTRTQGTKLLRWVGYGIVAVIVYFVLRNRGFL